jgi:excisionase family DNA binding protein
MKSAAPTLIIPRYIDASRTAQYLGITTQALYNLVARRFVPFRKMGKKLVFDVQELDAYIARLDGIGADEAADRILKEDAINLN